MRNMHSYLYSSTLEVLQNINLRLRTSFFLLFTLKVLTGKVRVLNTPTLLLVGCCWSTFLSPTGRCSSLTLLKNTLRGVGAGPGFLQSLLLPRIVCETSEAAASFHHQGEQEDEEEEKRKRRQTTAASAVSLRIGANGLLRAVS